MSQFSFSKIDILGRCTGFYHMALWDLISSQLLTQSHMCMCVHMCTYKHMLWEGHAMLCCFSNGLKQALLPWRTACTLPPSHHALGSKAKKGAHLSAGAQSLAKPTWEEVQALALKLNIRTWVPVLALSSPCCATLDTQLHLSEPQLLICERQLTTSTFQGCCEN